MCGGAPKGEDAGMSGAGRRPKGWEDGTAWIAEDVGPPNGELFDEDSMFALARFDAHVESESLASGVRNGPSQVSAGEAVAWARRHAARVIIRWFGPEGVTHASAGEHPVIWDDGELLPPWDDDLQLAPRRIPGWEHLDRTEDDPEISWEVVLRGDAWSPPPSFAASCEATLRAAADAELVAFTFQDTTPTPPADGEYAYIAIGEGLRVHLRLDASTHAQACERGETLVRHATSAAYGRQPPDLHLGPSDAFPTGSEAAATNARIDRTGRLF